MNPLQMMGMGGLDAGLGQVQNAGHPRAVNRPGSDNPWWPKSTSIQAPQGARIYGQTTPNSAEGMNLATGSYNGENNGRDAGQGMSTQHPAVDWLQHVLSMARAGHGGLGTLPRRDHLMPGRMPAMPVPSQTTGGAQSGSGGWA